MIGSNSNTDYTCSCPGNYGGDNCTGTRIKINDMFKMFIFITVIDCVLSCSPGEEANSGCTMCDPVHICLTSNPCQNGATCNIGTTNNDYTCSCPPNYTGQTCNRKNKFITADDPTLVWELFFRVCSLLSAGSGGEPSL